MFRACCPRITAMAPKIPEKTISEIAERISILDVISPCVPLTQAGKNYKGLCPFHPDKNPSFIVNPDRNTFHCFGCGTGGDAYSFFMKFHDVPFLHAVRELARQAGVPLAENYRKRDPQKEAAYQKAVALNRSVCQFYHQNLLQSPESASARKYLETRDVRQETIQRFSLGYAPNEWDRLVQFLVRNKASLELAASLGLILPKKSGRGYYDRFRNRIMFPILDTTDQVLAFGGRSLEEGDQIPKYLNSPESFLYHKGAVLYGLSSAQSSIRSANTVIIVEGYLDLIALHQNGFPHAVAVLGTALTGPQIDILKRYSRNFVLIFDGDAAGTKASFRNLAEFLEKKIPARAVYLPEDEDPDSFLRQKGKVLFQNLLDKAGPLLDAFLNEKTCHLENQDPVDKKVAVLRELLPMLKKIPDHLEQSLRIKNLAEKIGISELFLRDELSNIKDEWGKRINPGKDMVPARGEAKKWPAEEMLACHILIQFPSLIPRFIEAKVLESFQSNELRGIIEKFEHHLNRTGDVELPELIAEVEDPGFSDLLTALSCKEEFTDQEAAVAIEDSIRRIQKKSLKTRLEVLNKKIQEAENRNQTELWNQLCHEKNHLLKQEKALFR